MRNINNECKCYEYIDIVLNKMESEYKLDFEDACIRLLSEEIIEPKGFKSGTDWNQMVDNYPRKWDADNTNIMLALYCVLFPKIKLNKDGEGVECLKDVNIDYFGYKGRVGETLNSFGTMCGEGSKNRRIIKDKESAKHLDSLITQFSHDYHKPGNFIPFPATLNVPPEEYESEWGIRIHGDFFDVKLRIIKEEWDDILKGTSSVGLLNRNKSFFEPFKDVGFIGFCEYFYLGDYLKSGEIEDLCDHSGNTHKYIGALPEPNDELQCSKYINNATRIIGSRTERMANQLVCLMRE
ncbi:hypothetical protein YDYSY3_39000 [Paenibacillus chitinolyticus]|uniref:DUF6994 family protein n=1 Tax=Paenibacillus chitinolyticus TaxID=79263 RepID=UPI0026E4D0EB|nr:hypothetical protein [Paenibacillus chitinolyticus]GKS12900.1 hypothetical protein YDYSY3_39000 [Paenibacillus chitinolyticus]